MFRMSIKKAYHERNQENPICYVVISKNNVKQYFWCIHIQQNETEHNENNLAISLDRFHKVFQDFHTESRQRLTTN